MMLSNLQIAMNAVGDDEEAMMALESVDQELRSAAAAAGMSIGNTTDGGEGEEKIVKLTLPVNSSRDHIQGPQNALVTLLEYGDYECP
jgi:hypothetical protein